MRCKTNTDDYFQALLNFKNEYLRESNCLLLCVCANLKCVLSL
jgi:hypothetical protein